MAPTSPSLAPRGTRAPVDESRLVALTPSALIAHILSRYHAEHRRQLPELLRLSATVEAVHGQHPAVPAGLTVFLEGLQADLLDHMEKEENVLFPLLARGGHPQVMHPISAMRAEHLEHAAQLGQLLSLSHGATPPPGACSTWRSLYRAVLEFADDLRHHIALENDLLFPRFETRPA
jgi:regulator of cell morphogenesis and NO signaling